MHVAASTSGARIAVTRRALLDTGFIVALVNELDPDHEACVDVWRELRVQLVAVEGVLVEAAHLLRKARGGVEAAVGLIFGAGTELIATTQARADRAVVLMKKYRDAPMDLVDAMLVVVAEERNVRDVLTLDRRGFETYRVGRERFRIRP